MNSIEKVIAGAVSAIISLTLVVGVATMFESTGVATPSLEQFSGSEGGATQIATIKREPRS